MMNQLLAENLNKCYNNRNVVNNISININGGEIIGLLGPNGAGKTTCFYMILGLVPSDSGSIVLNQQDITKMPIHMRAKLGIGYLPQEASIFRKLSVANNIMAILETRDELTKNDRLQMLEDLLSEFNIGHIRNNTGISLSGGERRRVEIARSLATNPKFILLDEPFAGVDPISISDLKQIIYKLTDKGIGVLITDHNVEQTLKICNRVYIVHEGKVIAQGTKDTILSHETVRRVYLGDDFKI